MKFPFRKGKKMSEQTPETDNPNDVQAAAEEAQTPPSYEELLARVEELEGMVRDEQLRGLANEQNLRRRFQEELQTAHKYAAREFAKEMLTVKDYLEMALLDQSGNFDALKMGVGMTLNELQKAFDATGISELPAAAGDKLDPHSHQAMQEVEAEQEAGTIVAVLKKGYAMHERVLRPTMVTVAKAAEETASPEASATEEA